MLPTDYQAALDYIFRYVDYERRRSVPYNEATWDLNRARRVLIALGNPHQRIKFVHVAGSKGKGSTAAMVEAVLRASGFHTGLYTSPHLHTFRERIRVDGHLLEREDLVHLLVRCRPAIETVPGITTFEIITVLALLHFAQQEVEWAVLEVGLGGRLDATNVVTPAVSIITPVSFEHTELLGNTLAQIAGEKAGIIKPGVPVVVAPQQDEALAVIEEISRIQKARMVLVGRDWHWNLVEDNLDGQLFDVAYLNEPELTTRKSSTSALTSHSLCWPDECCTLSGLRIPLLGAHQLVNATTATAACRELAAAGVAISEQSLRQGLASVYWPGRLEVLARTGPVVVADCAHNEASAAQLKTALNRYFPDRPQHLVVGVSADKDARAILATLAPGAKTVTVTRSRHPRAADPAVLAQQASEFFSSDEILVAPTVAQALELALHQAHHDQLVCVTGSLFVVAEAREAWLAGNPRALPPADWVHQAEPPDPRWQVPQKLPTSQASAR